MQCWWVAEAEPSHLRELFGCLHAWPTLGRCHEDRSEFDARGVDECELCESGPAESVIRQIDSGLLEKFPSRRLTRILALFEQTSRQFPGSAPAVQSEEDSSLRFEDHEGERAGDASVNRSGDLRISVESSQCLPTCIDRKGFAHTNSVPLRARALLDAVRSVLDPRVRLRELQVMTRAAQRCPPSSSASCSRRMSAMRVFM